MNQQELQQIIDEAITTGTKAEFPDGLHTVGRNDDYYRAALHIPQGAHVDIVAGRGCTIKRRDGFPASEGDFAIIECKGSMRLLPKNDCGGATLDGNHENNPGRHNKQDHAVFIVGASHLFVDGWSFVDTPDDGIKIAARERLLESEEGKTLSFGVRQGMIINSRFHDNARTALTLHSGVGNFEVHNTEFLRCGTQAIDAEQNDTNMIRLVDVSILEAGTGFGCGLHGNVVEAIRLRTDATVWSAARRITMTDCDVRVSGGVALQYYNRNRDSLGLSVEGGFYEGGRYPRASEVHPFRIIGGLRMRGVTVLSHGNMIVPASSSFVDVEGNIFVNLSPDQDRVAINQNTLGHFDFVKARVVGNHFRGFGTAFETTFSKRYTYADGQAKFDVLECHGNYGVAEQHRFNQEHRAAMPYKIIQ